MIVRVDDARFAEAVCRSVIAAVDCPVLGRPGDLGDYSVFIVLRNNIAGAVFIFYGFQPAIRNVHVLVASSNRAWGTRANIAALMRVAFVDMGLRRVSATCRHDNEKAIKALTSWGFVREGTRRNCYGPKLHAVDFGLTVSDAIRWYKRAYGHGKVLSAA